MRAWASMKDEVPSRVRTILSALLLMFQLAKLDLPLRPQEDPDAATPRASNTTAAKGPHQEEQRNQPREDRLKGSGRVRVTVARALPNGARTRQCGFWQESCRAFLKKRTEPETRACDPKLYVKRPLWFTTPGGDRGAKICGGPSV